MAHPGGLVPQHLHSTSESEPWSLSRGAGSQRDAPWNCHNFHAVSGLPYFSPTSAIVKRRTREERAGQLANPPAREGREPGCRRSSSSSSSSCSSRSSSSSSEGHLVSGNPQSRAVELSPDNPAFDTGIALSRQSAALGAALSLYRADTPREEAGHTQKETHGDPGWGVEVDRGELASRPVLAACLTK